MTGFAAPSQLTHIDMPHMRFMFFSAGFCAPASFPPHLTVTQLPSTRSYHCLFLQRTFTV